MCLQDTIVLTEDIALTNSMEHTPRRLVVSHIVKKCSASFGTKWAVIAVFTRTAIGTFLSQMNPFHTFAPEFLLRLFLDIPDHSRPICSQRISIGLDWVLRNSIINVLLYILQNGIEIHFPPQIINLFFFSLVVNGFARLQGLSQNCSFHPMRHLLVFLPLINTVAVTQSCHIRLCSSLLVSAPSMHLSSLLANSLRCCMFLFLLALLVDWLQLFWLRRPLPSASTGCYHN